MEPETAAPLVVGLDHVQVAIPDDREAECQARWFYGTLLGLPEIPKPEALQARGGVWFACGDRALHVGRDPEHRPARKAHPGLLVRDLDLVRARLEAAGVPIHADVAIPGYRRLHTSDPAGNRIECLQRLPCAESEEPEDPSAAVKERVRAQFARTAAAYVTSRGHAQGDDLARLVELAVPAASDIALDIATGGGHTALTLAPNVAHVVASDLTPTMLATARRFVSSQGATNVEFVVADAERLPFLDATFDLVTVRIAPHHFADIVAACREMARVLQPGGRLIVVDNIAPEDPDLDAFVNEIEARRDPSHVRCYRASEWQALLTASGLHVAHMDLGRKLHDFAEWAARAQMPAAEQASLEHDMLAAPAAAREYFAIVAEDGHAANWTSEYVILRADKGS
jgi:ubiquinone/menaquinone biosynthesis C-methylase UbiE